MNFQFRKQKQNCTELKVKWLWKILHLYNPVSLTNAVEKYWICLYNFSNWQTYLEFVSTTQSQYFSNSSIWWNIYIYIYIYINPFAQAECDTRSIFKWILTSLNSEFSFFQTSCHTKIKEPCLPYHLPIPNRRIIGFIYFHYVKCKQSRPEFELRLQCLFSMAIAIISWAPEKSWKILIYVYCNSNCCN